MSKWYENESITDFKVDGCKLTFQCFEDAEEYARDLALKQLIRNPKEEVSIEINGMMLDDGDKTPRRYFVDAVNGDLNITLQSDED
jgi:hypothetical protein